MINSLSLFDFRNYDQKHFEFKKKVVFWGNNGKGKTNILEAISILSVGKSWRETKGTDLILNGQESSLIQAKVAGENAFKIKISPHSRTFERNEKKIPLKNHFGTIPSLLFVPEHLELFAGTKSNRQKYFDRFLTQISPTYRDNLLRANRARKQKNTILKSFREQTNPYIYEEISPWNKILSETIPLIWNDRQNFIKKINPQLQKELKKISGTDNPIQISLKTPEKFDPTPNGVLEFFKKHKTRETSAQKTLLGPHRDDFEFSLREKPILSSASRGEIRSVLLALLSTKKQILAEKNSQQPILLLDDVFSELDTHRQTHLEQICEESQVFFTTTHDSHFGNFLGEVQKIEV